MVLETSQRMFITIARKLITKQGSGKRRKLTWRKKNEQNNIVEASFEGIGEAFVSTLFVSSRSTMWYVDFGALTYLFHKWKWFQDYETISPIKIYMGDNFIQEVVGKGNIRLSMSMGEDETIEVVSINFLHVLGLAKNLFSITRAISLNHVFEFWEYNVW